RLQVRLRDLALFEFAPEDGLDGLLRVAELLPSPRQAVIGGGAGGEGPLFQPLPRVLVGAAAESVMSAPITVLLPALQAKPSDVRQQGGVRCLGRLFRLAGRVVLGHAVRAHLEVWGTEGASRRSGRRV